jgi:hypothetical protein
MRDRTLIIHLSGRWLTVALAILLVAAVLIPAAAFAAGTFSDDDGSTHEGNIEWLASAGITVGCNPPANDNYCPGDPVTRAQMATFLRRFAQFLGAENGPVRPSAAWWANDNLPMAPISVDRTVTVPAGGGTLLMVGSFDYLNISGGTAEAACSFGLNGAILTDSQRYGSYAPPGGRGLCVTNTARDVGPGTYVVNFWSSGDVGGGLWPSMGDFHVIVIPSA